MKKIIKISYITTMVLALALCIAACDAFLDTNTDPTRLKTASTAQVFTSAEASLAFYQGLDLFLYSSIFSQQATGSGVTSTQTRLFDQYILTPTDVNNAFTNYYGGTLADLDYMKKQAFKEGNPQYAGIAKLLEAFTFHILVDAWGDLPYKEALKGVANVQPHYDGSKEIYDSLFVLIDAGIAQVGQTNVRTIGAEDLIYGGDKDKWIRFGNTLKLRLALHYAKDDGGVLLKQFVTAGGPFMLPTTAASGSNPLTDNFQMIFENTNNRTNPINQFEIQRGNYYAPSKLFVDMMNTKADPRRPFYLTQSPAPVPLTSAGPWVGATSNSSQTSPNSRIHTYLRGAVASDNGARDAVGGVNVTPTFTAITYNGDAPVRMLTYAEYCFIRAEGALMYGTGAGTVAEAQTFYQAGITASMIDAGVLAADITAYIAANGAITGPADLKKIIEEKWVANYGVAMEPWTDWRRTGFPTLTASIAAVAQGNNNIPRVLIYPLSETSANSNNMPSRANIATKSVFWDK